MATVAWILLALAVAWHFASQRRSHRKRIQLESYVVYLLLSDDIRGRHQAEFRKWIASTDALDAFALSAAAHRVIDHMAESLAVGDPSRPGTSSTLGAHAMLWQIKQSNGSR